MTQLHALEEDLRQRLREIHVRLHRLHPRAGVEFAADARRDNPGDSAQAFDALEAQATSVERLTLAAREVTATLTRIADGTYGRCQECDAPIPPARLKVIPTAALCVSCQSAAERCPRPTWRHESAWSDDDTAVR